MIDARAILGHKRLSLLDLSEAGAQPMSDPSGRYTIVYNGEVYNFRQLGAALTREAGVVFASGSDTEVLLHHLIRHVAEPARALREWEGMFAFALYDRLEQTLFLARDRFGIKPLYYACRPDAFWFASEMKAPLSNSHYGRRPPKGGTPTARKSPFTALVYRLQPVFETV